MHSWLGEDIADDAAMDVCQLKLAALVLVGQPFVVDAQQMRDDGLQGADVDRVLGDVAAVPVGCPTALAGSYAAAGSGDCAH